MARAPLSGQQASKYVRVAQVAGSALAATAVLLWIGGVPGLAIQDRPREAIAVQPTPTEPPPAEQAAAGLSREDLDDMVQRLETARVQVKKPEVAVVPQPQGDDPPSDDPPPAAGHPRWRYLGAIIEPTRRVALISVEGRQRLLAEGRNLDGAELIAVDPEWIRVRLDGEEMQLPREERSGSPVAWVKVNTPAGRPAIPAGMNVGASVQVEEENGEPRGVFRRQNGLDPARADQMRQLAADRAERRRMLREREEMRRREVNGE